MGVWWTGVRKKGQGIEQRRGGRGGGGVKLLILLFALSMAWSSAHFCIHWLLVTRAAIVRSSSIASWIYIHRRKQALYICMYIGLYSTGATKHFYV